MLFRSISGGYGNTASGNCSAILGGTSNTTNGYANAMIVGSNITANRACTTFVNDLTITSMSACTGCAVCVSTSGLLVPYTGGSGAGNISGSGTTNYVAKFTSACCIGNSSIFDNGSYVGVAVPTQITGSLIVSGSSIAACLMEIGRAHV